MQAVSKTILCAGVAPARADDCAAMLNASIAVAKTPYSATVVKTGAMSGTDQVIYTGKVMYVQTRGVWHGLVMTPDEIVAEAKEKDKVKHSCERLGDESVGGEAATLYAMHTDTEAGHVDSRIWISKLRGLLLKSEIHLQNATMVETFKYGAVTPPAGVKLLGAK